MLNDMSFLSICLQFAANAGRRQPNPGKTAVICQRYRPREPASSDQWRPDQNSIALPELEPF
jgi:hypothetical protein